MLAMRCRSPLSPLAGPVAGPLSCPAIFGAKPLRSKRAIPLKAPPIENRSLIRASAVSRPAEDGPYEDVYPYPGTKLQYPPGKEEVKLFGRTAGELGFWFPLFLWLTEFTHYLTFATQLWLAYTLWQNTGKLQPRVDSMFWVIMAPVFQALAGFGPVVMHEYEGWQVALFKNLPTSSLTANNEQLRQAAYRVLFQFQAIGAGFFALGVFGYNQWYLAALAVLYFVPRKPLVPEVPPFKWLFKWLASVPFFGKKFGSLLPAPAAVFVTFIVAVVLFYQAQAKFFGPGALPPLWGFIPATALVVTILNAAGGIVEGVFAEGYSEQFFHWLAVVLLNLGGLLQVHMITSLVPRL